MTSTEFISTKVETKLSFQLDKFVLRLLSLGKCEKRLENIITEGEIKELIQATKEVFNKQPICLEIEPPIIICGDIHGQYPDLLRLFGHAGFPPEKNYLFLGDYVDRGKQSLEVIIMMMAYKVLYPDSFFILRGNHECYKVNRIYGFYEEINRRYKSPSLYDDFSNLFDFMPLTAIVGDKILCMHGGLSPELKKRDDLKNIPRPICPYKNSIVCDLLWSDPDSSASGFTANARGISYLFGTNVVLKTLEDLNLELICRAHQVVQDGYEFFANKRLVTIFSAPHYCGQFSNNAAYMEINEDLLCNFVILKPSIKMRIVAGPTPKGDLSL
ncbi:Serine/threonine-protein phosphatase PP1-beta catalytic subunit [Strongyloides ratti]|uniref:Serine/threonine-protein phosphatase n=1 Tax=Strongyloides ratti TaxID=34506 RepID=A0A090L4T0_STRRB|nr:Serine/threonine-protein phosphatase PP1-beta catalytic subunit [Strongyloides ratti]CEF64697.1 Serine/threonine-protein phosphatase PP1-beta catalytic subunit [Strongyloides ratti]